LLPQWKDKATIRAVFLDRDGTLIVEKNYLHDPEEVELLPGVVDGLKLLLRHGFALIVVTNQSGVGRGYYSLEAMHAVNKRLGDILKDEGVELDAVYYCPHTPDERCSCRKPELGMLRQAIREKGICLSGSFVVGDKEADISLGNNAGMRTVFVRTGYGAETERQESASSPSYVSDTLYDAAWWIAQN
jgi:D-glycero-D-manno-heptose 1,7-bisphosphate phosphatase